jgi:hypothetical protein
MANIVAVTFSIFFTSDGSSNVLVADLSSGPVAFASGVSPIKDAL